MFSLVSLISFLSPGFTFDGPSSMFVHLFDYGAIERQRGRCGGENTGRYRDVLESGGFPSLFGFTPRASLYIGHRHHRSRNQSRTKQTHPSADLNIRLGNSVNRNFEQSTFLLRQ